MSIMLRRGINYKNIEAMQLKPEHIEYYRTQVTPLLQRWCDEGLGDFKVEDIYACLQDGRMSLLMFHTEGDIRIVALMEFIQYPQRKVLGFLGFAGEKPLLMRKFMPWVKVWAKENGATHLETYANQRAKKYMERLGFGEIYSYMRAEI